MFLLTRYVDCHLASLVYDWLLSSTFIGSHTGLVSAYRLKCLNDTPFPSVLSVLDIRLDSRIVFKLHRLMGTWWSRCLCYEWLSLKHYQMQSSLQTDLLDVWVFALRWSRPFKSHSLLFTLTAGICTRCLYVFNDPVMYVLEVRGLDSTNVRTIVILSWLTCELPRIASLYVSTLFSYNIWRRLLADIDLRGILGDMFFNDSLVKKRSQAHSYL